MTKSHILQTSEYDVTQKIIEAFTNLYSRTILFSIKVQAKDATQISSELHLSISTVYKILSTLENLALIEVDKFKFLDGKKIKLYKSRIGQIEILMRDTEPIVSLYPNNEKTRELAAKQEAHSHSKYLE